MTIRKIKPKSKMVEELMAEDVTFSKTKTGFPMSAEYIEKDLKEAEEKCKVEDEDIQDAVVLVDVPRRPEATPLDLVKELKELVNMSGRPDGQ